MDVITNIVLMFIASFIFDLVVQAREFNKEYKRRDSLQDEVSKLKSQLQTANDTLTSLGVGVEIPDINQVGAASRHSAEVSRLFTERAK